MSWTFSTKPLLAFSLLAVGGLGGWMTRSLEGDESGKSEAQIRYRVPTDTFVDQTPSNEGNVNEGETSPQLTLKSAPTSHELNRDVDVEDVEDPSLDSIADGAPLSASLARLEQGYQEMMRKTALSDQNASDDEPQALREEEASEGKPGSANAPLQADTNSEATALAPPNPEHRQPVDVIGAGDATSEKLVGLVALSTEEDESDDEEGLELEPAAKPSTGPTIVLNYAPVFMLPAALIPRTGASDDSMNSDSAPTATWQSNPYVTSHTGFRGTSPWAPIDMTGQNNPWQATRTLP